MKLKGLVWMLALPLILTACPASTPTAPPTPTPGPNPNPAPTPAPTPVPGATLNVQLSQNFNTASWALGAATVELRAYVDPNNTAGDIFASGTVDATGAGTVALPGEAQGVNSKATHSPTEAASWLNDILNFSCTSNVTSSNPGVKALLAIRGDFSTNEGGGHLIASKNVTGGSVFDLLTYVTAGVTVSGTITCGSTSSTVSLALDPGWNIVETQASNTGALNVVKRPLSNTVQLTRSTN